MRKSKITAIVPAYNEEGTIGGVVAALTNEVDSVVVVDDGSTDQTGELARKEGATVLTHVTNQGYDEALSHGVSYAADNSADIIVTFDADGQHEVEDIGRVVEPIEEGSAEIVVGRRPHAARPAEGLFAVYTSWRLNIDDPLSGFKAYDIEVYRDVGYFDRFSSIGTHLMIAAIKKGYRVSQVDISVSEREDQPRFGNLKGNWLVMKALGRIILFDVQTTISSVQKA